MTTGGEKKKVPFKEGLFKVPQSSDDKGYLIGTKCPKCGDHFYPKKEVCLGCGSFEMEEVPLSTKGKVFTYTIARQGYPMTPMVPPFITGLVQLPEKAWCISEIRDCDFDKVHVGMDVELCFWKVQEDAESESLAFAFRPIPT